MPDREWRYEGERLRHFNTTSIPNGSTRVDAEIVNVFDPAVTHARAITPIRRQQELRISVLDPTGRIPPASGDE